MKTALTVGINLSRLRAMDESIKEDIDAGLYDGAAYQISRYGKPVHQGVYGFANREAGQLLNDNDVFATMSIGKQLSNVTALQLIERGKLTLHTRVADLIPSFEKPELGRITLFHILNQTSGIMSAIPQVDPAVLVDTEKLTEYLATQPLDSSPGEVVNYSIVAAHSVLAEMVKAADNQGRSFTEIIEQELLRPLGMLNTSLGGRADLLERFCPVIPRFDGPALCTPEEVAGFGFLMGIPNAEVPAGLYLTTLDDFDRFTRMLANDGELDGVRILSPNMLKYCRQVATGTQRNQVFDYMLDLRNWREWRANIGLGFFVRGEGVIPGPVSNFSSPETFFGMGSGTSCFWVDPQNGLSLTFLSTGAMEDSHNIQRLQKVSDIIVCSVID